MTRGAGDPDPELAAAADRSWGMRLKRGVAMTILLGALVAVGTYLGSDGSRSSKANSHWTFLEATTPADLGLVARGTGGTWALEDYAPATGGRALANHEGTPAGPPALLVASSFRVRDVRTRTRCKVAAPGHFATQALETEPDAALETAGDPAVPDGGLDPPAVPDGGAMASACGVVFRFVDEQNHWLARVDLDRGTIEAVILLRGRELLLKRAPAGRTFTAGEWVDLAVEARGDVVRVTVDNAISPAIVTGAPAAHAAFGAVGLWAPSDAVVFFDHFVIETLAPTPRALEILPILGKKP